METVHGRRHNKSVKCVKILLNQNSVKWKIVTEQENKMCLFNDHKWVIRNMRTRLLVRVVRTFGILKCAALKVSDIVLLHVKDLNFAELLLIFGVVLRAALISTVLQLVSPGG